MSDGKIITAITSSSSFSLSAFLSSWTKRPAILYSSVFAWVSITGGRFIAPFLEQEAGNLSTSEIGLALALQECVTTLFSSLGGSYADKVECIYPGKGRALVMGAGILFGTAIYLLHAVPEEMHASFFGSRTALYHILLRCLYALSLCLIFPVLDGTTVHYLEQQSRSGTSKADFGKERLFGAWTWAITNVCMAPLLDRYGFRITYPGASLACGLVLWTIFLFLATPQQQQQQLQQQHMQQQKSQIITPDDDDNNNVIQQNGGLSEMASLDADVEGEQIGHEVQRQHQYEADTDGPHQTWTILSLLRLLLGSAYGGAFIFAVLCLSQGQALVESLIFLFFEFLGSSYTLMGWTVVLTVAFEIPIFHIAPQLLQQWGSTVLLLVGCFGYIVRVVGYSIIPNGHVAYVLLLEPLHGVTFACSTTASVDFVANLMPTGYEASGQGLIYLFKGMGSILGLLLGGYAEDRIGPRLMYRISALVVMIGFVVLFIIWKALPRSSQQSGNVKTGGQNNQLGGHCAVSQTEDDESTSQIELTHSSQ